MDSQRKRELKEAYRTSRPPMGVLSFRCVPTGESFLLASRNIPGDTNGVTLKVTEAGERGAPVVVLAHGFPELAHSWRHQIPALAAAGYHVGMQGKGCMLKGERCITHDLWDEMGRHLHSYLASVTLADLVDGRFSRREAA